jgi:tight adherence protein B
MVAETFLGSPAFLAITVAVVALAVFSLGWLLFGTAIRARNDREMAARMTAAGRRGPGHSPLPVPAKGAGGWIPGRVTSFGERFAEARGFSERLDAELEAAGLSLNAGEFVIVTVAAGLLGAVLGAALFGSWIVAVAIGAIASCTPTVFLRSALRRRADKLREQLPDVLTIMASSLRAGHSFLQSLDATAKEIAQPAAGEFQRVVAEVRLGRSADDALEAMSQRVGSEDFRWAVLAVNIQREVGGNLAEILDNVAATLLERATIRRQIRVLTAEGRLSAWVLGLLPFGIGVYMGLSNPDYVGLLFTRTMGIVMLGGSGFLLVAGVLWMRKIVNIDV